MSEVRGAPSIPPPHPMAVREWLSVGVFLLVSLIFQCFVIATHRVPFNSDQALVGLMAKHILQGNGHPVFYYGATYAGSVEPHFVAAVFAVAGISRASYRIAMMILLSATVLVVFFSTRAFFGRRPALIALACVSVAPFFFLYKGLTSDGAYASAVLLELATISLALGVDQRLARGKTRRGLLCALGLGVGIAWWVTPITAAPSAVCLGWLWIRKRGRPAPHEGLWVALGLVVGAFPWWSWNLSHDWASLRAPELGHVGISDAARQLVDMIWTSLPVLEGGVRSTPDPAYIRETFFLSRIICLVAVVWLLSATIVRVRKERGITLLWLVVGALFAVGATSDRLVLSEPRYLVGYYAVAPLLIGAGFSNGAGRRAQLGALFVLLAVHMVSIGTARVSDRIAEGEVTGSLEPLQRFLQDRGIHSVYTDYWTAYRLTFESGERLIATPLPGDEMVRYLPYEKRVEEDPSPSIVLLESRSVCFEAYLRQQNVSHQRSQVGTFGVYWALGESALASLRKGWGLPLPRQAHAVTWNLGPQPSEMMTSESRAVRVKVWNRSPCRWPVSVHLGYHWWPDFPGGQPVYEGGRAVLRDRVAPHDWATFDAKLVAPARQGRYRLEYDLVQENIQWFSDGGGSTASVLIEVKAPAQAGS